MLEVSAVGIPANPNAIALALKDGAVEKNDLREIGAMLKHLDGIGAGTACPREGASAQQTQTPADADKLSALQSEEFCTQPAGPAADARAPGRETDGAQWLQLAREVTEVAKGL